VEEKGQWAVCGNLSTFKPPCSAACEHLLTLFTLLSNVTAVEENTLSVYARACLFVRWNLYLFFSLF